MDQSVIIKSNKHGIIMILDPDVAYDQLLKNIVEKFNEYEKFFKNAKVGICFEGRELTSKQEREILDLITKNSTIQIICIIDKDELKESYFKKKTDAYLEESAMKNGQFYKGTLRSGQVLEAESSLIILGDVNPGAKVISKSNIIVLGALKGNAYAGASGNEESFVAALDMRPVQIKIGDVMARCSDQTPKKGIFKSKHIQTPEPQIAFVEEGNIYIELISKGIMF